MRQSRGATEDHQAPQRSSNIHRSQYGRAESPGESISVEDGGWFVVVDVSTVRVQQRRFMHSLSEFKIVLSERLTRDLTGHKTWLPEIRLDSFCLNRSLQCSESVHR